MLSRRFAWLTLALVPWSCPGSQAHARLFPPGAIAHDDSSLQARLWSDLADDRLDDFTLLEAALIAGGLESRASLDHHNRQLADWLSELQSDKPGNPKERARAVFEFMHRRVLSAGFRQESTSLAGALDEGRFNCVSSTILFLTLARGCGLEVEAVAEPAHVFCRLIVDRVPMDVQTTDPRAFEPERQTLAPSIDSAPRALSEKGLLALVYYNAGVEELSRREFGKALEANGRALRLDPDHREARANLLATYNNWAVECVRQQQFQQATALIQSARELAPGHAHLTTNLRSVYQQWAAAHLQAGRFKEAQAVLDESLETLTGDEVLTEARHAVERRWMKARERKLTE